MKIYRPSGKCNLCGTAVRRLRKQAGLSQEELAAKIQLFGLDLTQKAISRIETGDRVVADYELVYLSKALDVTFEELLTHEDLIL